MFRNIVKNEYINIHGPEHHILDGACLLMAFYNAGGKIDIDAALAIIDGTGPLSTDGTWGNHMQFTSAICACAQAYPYAVELFGSVFYKVFVSA